MRRLQKEISTSRLSWPIAAMTSLLFWFIAWLEDNVTFLPFVLMMVTGLLMMWVNHLFALIRLFSRMIASSFLVFTTALIIVPDIGGMQLDATFLQLCLIGFLILFFSCYQYQKAQGVILYAFLLIGLASLAFKQILFLVPLLWLLTGYCMVTFSTKIWISSIFGVCLPYLFLFTYYMMVGTPYEEMTIMHNWEFCKAFNFSGVSTTAIISFTATSLLSGLGIIHLIREGHKDKVRTRMMYQIFIAIAIFSIVMTLLQPIHIIRYTALQLISTGAMVGRFFAMTDSKQSNITFITITVIAYLLTIYNLL